jgi:hypothetical protein
MLSSGMKRYHLELMLSSGMKCFHLGCNAIIRSKCYHLGQNAIIWSQCYNSIIRSSCYHLVLSCDVIIWDDNTPLFYFSWKLHSLYKFGHSSLSNVTHAVKPVCTLKKMEPIRYLMQRLLFVVVYSIYRNKYFTSW